MPRKAIQPPPRQGSLDRLMSSKSAVRARLGNDEKVSVDYIEACGDCFYMAVETALAESEGWQPWHAVAAMREVVASQLTEEIFQMYTLLHAQQADGFDWMRGVDSLEALRKRIRLRGQQVGAGKCVWADGFAMETVANHYRLLLLVVDERFSGAQKFTRISPSGAGPSEETPLGQEQGTVLLHASQREHMNLIRYAGKKLVSLGDLPSPLQKLWGIAVPPWHRSPTGAGPSADAGASSTAGPTAAGRRGASAAATTASRGRGRGRGRGARGSGGGSGTRGRGGGARGRGRGGARSEAAAVPTAPVAVPRVPPPRPPEIDGAPSKRTRGALLAATSPSKSKRARGA